MIKTKYYPKAMLIILLISSCNFLNRQTAKEMNDKLIIPTDSLYNKAVRWGTLFSTINGGDHNFQLLKPVRVDMEKYIQSSLKEIKNLKDVNGSDALRQAVINYLQYESEVMKEFIGFESLTPSSSEEEIKTMLDKLSETNDKENNLMTGIKDAQQEYAKRNNFILMDKR